MNHVLEEGKGLSSIQVERKEERKKERQKERKKEENKCRSRRQRHTRQRETEKHAQESGPTTAERLFFIKVQVKPEGNSIHDALCYHIQLHDVVSAPALALPLKEVLKHLAWCGEAGMGQLIQPAGFITLIHPVTVSRRLLNL